MNTTTTRQFPLVHALSLFVGVLILFASVAPAHAQDIGLTISPPLDVVQTQDNKPLVLAFTIRNDGSNDFTVTPSVHEFTSDDQTGQPVIDEEHTVSYVVSQTPGITLNQPFPLAAHQSQQFVLRITPPDGLHTDLQLTALMKAVPVTTGMIGQSGASTQVVTGANMVIQPTKTTVSELTLDLYETPAFIDVFEPIRATLRAHNNSDTLTQSRGTVSLQRGSSQPEQLTVFPDLILATHSRFLRSIVQKKGTNEPSTFTFNAPHFPGMYTLTTSIAQVDGSTKTYTKTIYVLPFTLTAGFAIIMMIVVILFTLRRRRLPAGI